jgi:hypothetical protein
MIGSKIVLLEEITGCKLVSPRGILGDLYIPVDTTPLSLSMLRFGLAQDTCGNNIFESTVQGENGLELTSPRSPSNACSYPLSPEDSSQILKSIKLKASTPGVRDLSVRKNPSAVLTHAVVRLAHALYVEKLYNMSESKLQTSTEQSKCYRAFTEQSDLQVTGNFATDFQSSLLHDLALLTERIQHIIGQCGVLCGLWVMALSLDSDIPLEISDLELSTDTAEVDRIVDLVDSSPFELERLMNPEYVACATLLDIFATLTMPLGPSICQRAAENLVHITLAAKLSQTDTAASHEGAGGARRERAEKAVLGVLLVCAEEDSPFSSDTGTLSFDVGSNGVIDCPTVVGMCSAISQVVEAKEGSMSMATGQLAPFCIHEMKAAVRRGCKALLSAMQHEDLQVALSLPMTASDVYRGRMESEAVHQTLEDREAEISVALELCDISSDRTAKEHPRVRKEVCSEECTTWCSLLEDRHSLITVKVVALFHLWKRLCDGVRSREALVARSARDAAYVGMEGVERGMKVEDQEDDHGDLDEDYMDIMSADLSAGWAATVFCETELTAQGMCELFQMLHNSSHPLASRPVSSPGRCLSDRSGASTAGQRQRSGSASFSYSYSAAGQQQNGVSSSKSAAKQQQNSVRAIATASGSTVEQRQSSGSDNSSGTEQQSVVSATAIVTGSAAQQQRPSSSSSIRADQQQSCLSARTNDIAAEQRQSRNSASGSGSGSGTVSNAIRVDDSVSINPRGPIPRAVRVGTSRNHDPVTSIELPVVAFPTATFPVGYSPTFTFPTSALVTAASPNTSPASFSSRAALFTATSPTAAPTSIVPLAAQKDWTPSRPPPLKPSECLYRQKDNFNLHFTSDASEVEVDLSNSKMRTFQVQHISSHLIRSVPIILMTVFVFREMVDIMYCLSVNRPCHRSCLCPVPVLVVALHIKMYSINLLYLNATFHTLIILVLFFPTHRLL